MQTNKLNKGEETKHIATAKNEKTKQLNKSKRNDNKRKQQQTKQNSE